MFITNKELTYLDKVTLMNHIRDLAKKDLQIESDTTPYVLDYLMNIFVYGQTTSAETEAGKRELLYVKINESQSIDQMINTIFHETKHVEQFINQPLYYKIAFKIKQFLEKRNRYYGLAYTLAMHEISARRYAKRATKKYRKQLTEMINSCEDGTLKCYLA